MSDVTKNVAVDIVAQETKAEKFIRIGEYRMNKALDAIGRLENLANRSAYEYTQEQAEAMFSVLEQRVADIKAKFTAAKQKEGVSFSFGTKRASASRTSRQAAGLRMRSVSVCGNSARMRSSIPFRSEKARLQS